MLSRPLPVKSSATPEGSGTRSVAVGQTAPKFSLGGKERAWSSPPTGGLYRGTANKEIKLTLGGVFPDYGALRRLD